MSALIKYTESLTNYPARGGGLHQHIMSSACLGTIAEIPPSVIINDMEASFAGIKHNEAADAVAKASRMEFSNAEYNHTPTEYKPKKQERTLDDFIGGQTRDSIELLDVSRTNLYDDPGSDGLLLLETLYKIDDILFIGDVFDREVKSVANWLASDLTKYPHIIPNPMTGREGLTDAAKISYRCENTVADARYAVCEMDTVPLGKQVSFWLECISIGIPVAAVIHSGRKSLHGWVKVDCGTDTDKWDELVRGWWFKDFGASYNLDPACQNRSRLSRLPGHNRESGGMQKLLYLNGDA